MEFLTKESFDTIKARIKSEVLRRNNYGSITSFGSSEYDVTITIGEPVTIEQSKALFKEIN